MGYKVLSFKRYGQALFETEDLDPVYCMLVRSNLDPKALRRWCLAFWCFYDVGTASRIIEGKDFWKQMFRAFDFGWRRSADRRHFRTGRAREALLWLRDQGLAEEIVEDWINGKSFGEVKKRLAPVPEFGSWAVFKIADMGERIFRKPISFDDCYEQIDIYSAPRKCAAILETGNEDDKVDVGKVIKKWERKFNSYKAPPWYDRPINIQEVETVLCKYRQHVRDDYPVGKDIMARTNELTPYELSSDVCRNMLRALRRSTDKLHRWEIR